MRAKEKQTEKEKTPHGVFLVAGGPEGIRIPPFDCFRVFLYIIS